jgi:transposase
MNEQLQSTLFVGIDVSSKSNYVYAMDFFAKKLLSFSCSNNLPGASVLITNLCNCLETENLKYVVIAMESTSYYSFHICNYLASSPELVDFKPSVFCLNPKIIKAYRESFISLDKTDPLDSMVIADFARTGKIASLPFSGSAFVALQRLTRQRLHVVENLNREKNFVLSNIFLKFSELAVLDKEEQPFSDRFGATASSIITDFLTPDEVACMPLDELISFISTKGKNRFPNPENTAKLLQKACRDSYRLDKALYDPLNVTIAASFNCISALERQIKELDKAILKAVKGLSSNEYQCLLSIKGIGPVFAARYYC